MSQNGKNIPEISYGKAKSDTPPIAADASAYTLSITSPQSVIVPNMPFAIVLNIRTEKGTLPATSLDGELLFPKNVLAPTLSSRVAWFFDGCSAPTLLTLSEADGALSFSILPSAECENRYLAFLLPTSSQIPPDTVKCDAILYADGQTVATASASFSVSCAHLDYVKERIHTAHENQSAFRIRLINNGTVGACSIEVEDILPPAFSVDHVLYCGLELAENLQYTQQNRRLHVKLPTCIPPQSEAELKILGHTAEQKTI